MAHRSNSTDFSSHGNEQDKRKKGIFSKVFGSGNSGNRQTEDSQSPYSSQRVRTLRHYPLPHYTLLLKT